MKKFISILTLLCMLLTIAPAGLVSATGEAGAVSVPDPYFDLDFTGTVGQAATATDAKNNATVTAGANNTTSTNAPILRTDSTNNVNYLEFDNSTTSGTRNNGRAAIKVLFPDTSVLTGVTGEPVAGDIAEGYTVELWGNFTSTVNWGVIFSFCNDQFNDIETDFRLQTNFKGLAAKKVTGASAADGVDFSPTVAGSGYLNAWHHYTVTRTYDATTKTFTLSLYIDGELKGSNTQTITDETLSYVSSHKGMFIGNNNNERAMTGGIADFKVYTTALTAEQTKAAYDASVETYYPTDDGGDDNTGDDNTGDDNTGDDNTGDDNTGDDNTSDLTPYFELGISKAEDGTVTVSDVKGHATSVEMDSTSTSTTSTDGAGTAYASQRPVYTTDETNGVNYLKFATDANPSSANTDSDRINGHARVKVKFPNALILSGTETTPTATDIAEGLTVETWAKVNTTAEWNGLFAFGTNHYTSGTAGTSDIQFRHTGSYFASYDAQRMSGSTNAVNFVASTNYKDKWAHYVYTREYDATTKAFTTKLYIDGVLQETKTTNHTTTNAYSTAWNNLTIGAAGCDISGYGRSLIGGIAEFKVYTTALTAAQAEAAYDASVDTYYPPLLYPTKGKIFEMDLTGCSPASGEVAQTLAVEATDDTAKYVASVDYLVGNGNKDKGTPVVKTEDGVTYLEFSSYADGDWTNTGAGVDVNLADTDDNTSVANLDSLAAEMWVRGHNYGAAGATVNTAGRINKSIFSFGSSNTYNYPAFAAWQSNSTNQFTFRPDDVSGNASTKGSIVMNHGSIANGQNAWTHYFVTREWIKDETASTTDTEYGRWQSSLYVNGALQSTVLSPAADKAAVTRQDYDSVMSSANEGASLRSFNVLSIGNDANEYDQAFCGDIAAFTLYSGSYSADEAMVLYASSAEAFTGDEILNMAFYNQDGTLITEENVAEATEVNINSIVIPNRTDTTKPFIAVAAYTTIDGVPVLVKCETFADTDFRIVQDGDLYHIVGNKTMDIEGLDINELKLFVWDSASNIKPIAIPHCL